MAVDARKVCGRDCGRVVISVWFAECSWMYVKAVDFWRDMHDSP